MVARDGIEPPTPAFSGPRSTTELPGLSADFQLHFLRGIRCCRKTWMAPRTVRCNDSSSIPTHIRPAKPEGGRRRRSAKLLLAGHAILNRTERNLHCYHLPRILVIDTRAQPELSFRHHDLAMHLHTGFLEDRIDVWLNTEIDKVVFPARL